MFRYFWLVLHIMRRERSLGLITESCAISSPKFVLSSLCLCCFLITVAFSHKWRSSPEAVLLIHRHTVWDIADQNTAFLFTDVVLNLLSQKSTALYCTAGLSYLSLCWILRVHTWMVPFPKVPTSWSCASYMSPTPYQNIPRNSLDPPQAINFLTGCCRWKCRCWSQITHALQSDWELGRCIAEAYVWVTDYRGNDSCKKREKKSVLLHNPSQCFMYHWHC